ncbi:hypothetical protein B0H14DRAFT_3859324, partial [Mycena olivaceomarginata]
PPYDYAAALPTTVPIADSTGTPPLLFVIRRSAPPRYADSPSSLVPCPSPCPCALLLPRPSGSSHAPLPQAQYTLLPDAHPAPSLALRSADSTYTLPHLSTPACSLRLKFVRTRAHSRCPYPSQYNSTRERVLPSLTPSVRRSFTTFPALFPSPSPPYPASLIPAFPVSPLPPSHASDVPTH